MRLILIGIIISFNAIAIEWTELSEKSSYKITQDFQLTQLERSGSKLDISKGDKVYLKEVMPLSAVNVILYIFDYKNCPGPALKTDMDIIPVHGTSPLVEIGAQLEENCELNIYIENKDLMSNSLFE
jgi:hypothetical protein